MAAIIVLVVPVAELGIACPTATRKRDGGLDYDCDRCRDCMECARGRKA